MKPISYFIETRGNVCENCGKPFGRYNYPNRHHCIEPRMKGKPELDNEINIEITGFSCCHISGMLDTQEHAIEFARRQIARGYDVLSWYKNLDLKTRRFPNLKSML